MIFKTPLPLGISNDLPSGGYGFFLGLYTVTGIDTEAVAVLALEGLEAADTGMEAVGATVTATDADDDVGADAQEGVVLSATSSSLVLFGTSFVNVICAFLFTQVCAFVWKNSCKTAFMFFL